MEWVEEERKKSDLRDGLSRRSEGVEEASREAM
jgi:hypothetical protein